MVGWTRVSSWALLCVPISASSCADTDGCSRGVLRPYQPHRAISPSVGRLDQIKACCQPRFDHERRDDAGRERRAQAEPHGLQALHVGPATGGNQASKTPADTGKIAPCAQPSRHLEGEQGDEQCLPAEELRRKRCRNGGEESGETDDDEGAASAQTLTDYARPAAEKCAYPNTKACSSQPICSCAEAEFGHHPFGGHGDAFLLHVGDESEPEEK